MSYMRCILDSYHGIRNLDHENSEVVGGRTECVSSVAVVDAILFLFFLSLLH